MCWFRFKKVRKYFFGSKDKKTYDCEASVILEDRQLNFLSNLENPHDDEDQFEIL
jgi:hypothetical protein